MWGIFTRGGQTGPGEIFGVVKQALSLGGVRQGLEEFGGGQTGSGGTLKWSNRAQKNFEVARQGLKKPWGGQTGP